MLRAADGTGLIFVQPEALAHAGSQLASGDYRLHLTYRRDNGAADPASIVLTEAGDSTEEVAENRSPRLVSEPPI